ncbi:MAG: ABC transporter permease [Gammaproteobacteria bacterium]
MRLERREATPWALTAVAPLLAVLLVAALGSALILWSGAPVLASYAKLVKGAFGSRFALTETLARATPLIFTGLAAATAFRARLWNIGGEGQFYLGALTAAALGASTLALPAWAMIPLVLSAGAVAGAALLLGPVVLKIRFSVDEVVTTLLLNFVVILFVSMMIEGPLKDPQAFGWPQSASVQASAVLPKVVARSRLHLGFPLALMAALLLTALDVRGVWGLESRAVGHNRQAARFAGIAVDAVVVRVALISGALAGLAGAVEVTGLKGYLTLDLSPGFGYSGIVVAMLAQLHPLGVVAAAILVAGVFVGADAMGRGSGVPSFIADVMVAAALLAMLLAILVAQYRMRR